MRYINGLTVNKKQLRAWCCTSSELSQFGKITVKYVRFSVSIDILFAQKEQNCYHQTRFRASKYIKNAFAARGSAPDPALRDLTALPQAP